MEGWYLTVMRKIKWSGDRMGPGDGPGKRP